MAILVPSYPNPFDTANPLQHAYAFVASLSLDVTTASGSVRLAIHPNQAASVADPPQAELAVRLGQSFPGGAKVPGLADLLADPDFAAAYQTIKAKLEAMLIGTVPALAGSART